MLCTSLNVLTAYWRRFIWLFILSRTALARKVIKLLLRVRPSVCLHSNFWTTWPPLTLIFSRVRVTTIARRGLKIKVIGQGQGLELGLAWTVTQSVWYLSLNDENFFQVTDVSLRLGKGPLYCIVMMVVARFSFVGCSMLCTSGFADEHLAVESYTVIMLLTFILEPVINSISSPLTLSFQSLNLSYLQILSTVVFHYFRTDSMDSADCLPILLSISDFFTFLFFTF